MDETDHLDSKKTADASGSSNADRPNEKELVRLRRRNLGIEAHLAERTTDNVVRGSEWICRRCDHSCEAGAALWTANRIVTVDRARERRESAQYPCKHQPAIHRIRQIEEQHGCSNSGNGHDVCETFLTRQFFPNGHIGLTRPSSATADDSELRCELDC